MFAIGKTFSGCERSKGSEHPFCRQYLRNKTLNLLPAFDLEQRS